jgi:hypothetical protein
MLRLLTWSWLAIVLLFFSLPSSKLVGYALPALPPLAALVADGVWALGHDAARTERRLRAVALVAALACVAAVFAARGHDQRSNEPLARVLLAQRRAGDAVIFIERYFYDVPFYARLREPVWVVEAWRDAGIDRRDDWRRELADAARFAAPERRAVLVLPQDLAQRVCAHAVSWLFGPPDAVLRHPVLASATPVAHTTLGTLWKLDARAAGCVTRPEMPNGPPST